MIKDFKETITRQGSRSFVVAGEGYYQPGKLLCCVEDTGNGYIARFPGENVTRQDYYVCLNYSQVVELIQGLSMFKKELGFV
jgi:hypothetical protein